MQFNNIQEVRDYINSIPEKDFCVGNLEDSQGKRCVAGHLNMALHGNTAYDYKDADNTSIDSILRPFEGSNIDLVMANNGDEENPKRGALKYLDSLIKN